MESLSSFLFSGDFILYLVGPLMAGFIIHGIIEALAKAPADNLNRSINTSLKAAPVQGEQLSARNLTSS
jgi:hypothetical protein